MRIRKARTLLLSLIACACLTGATLAFAATSTQTFTIQSHFTPDKLGAPANLSVRAAFSANGAVPAPIGRVLAWGPAGLKIDVAGAGTCNRSRLEAQGPAACPANSRIGFGGGIGLQELGKQLIKEPFTLDFFLAPKENGRVVILVYVEAKSPVAVELVIVAKETRAPKPYGFAVEFEIPPIPTLPGASYASLESTYFTVGSQHIAYYHRVHGKRRLVNVKGLIVPKTCPKGGFPFKAMITYLDGTSGTYDYTVPCPVR